MKTEQTMWIAFLLNLSFSVFECIGGAVTGSVAILSDAIHDVGDAIGIGVACVLEKKSKHKADNAYTYGYVRYSVIGGCFTSGVLIFGSVWSMCQAMERLRHPVDIHYTGMMVLAAVGVCINVAAVLLTHKGDSLNQKAVYWHMIEDVLGWLVVLVGSVAMRFTDLAFLDPLMSIGVSLYILIHAIVHAVEAVVVLLEKAPKYMDAACLKVCVETLEGVYGVHHIHVWTLDGYRHAATLHVVTEGDTSQLKKRIRDRLREYGIEHVTVETESLADGCSEYDCSMGNDVVVHHNHHGK